jgi:hypothetical protein
MRLEALRMLHKRLRKTRNKINEATVNLRGPLATPIGKQINRKAIFAATCLLTVVVLSVIIVGFGSSKSIVYASSVKGIGVGIYWDQACTNRTLSLDWGLIGAGSNNTLTIYVKNEGNSPASLWLETSNWTPSDALGYMSLNWNYSGQVLNAGQVIPLQLTLTVDPTINGISNFSFVTTIIIS